MKWGQQGINEKQLCQEIGAVKIECSLWRKSNRDSEFSVGAKE